MANCPLCSERAGKRYCPAKDCQICAVCCGTKREIEIDCPGSCVHLKAARSYEAEKRTPDPELAAKIHKYNSEFLRKFTPILDAITRAVVEERIQSTWLVDNDVIDVYKCLRATMKTLSSGIYYETAPDTPMRLSLFRRLKTGMDELMQPSPNADHDALKISEALDVLDFLTFAAQLNSSIRPKSRRYLDLLTEMSGMSVDQPSGLIIP